jgi:hypothetical protein
VTAARIALLAALGVVGTIVAGWWTLVVVGVLRGLPVPLLPRRGAVTEAACAGGLAWAALLAWSGMRGPVGRLARVVGPIFHLPAWALLTLTVAFAVVAAGAAAAVTGQVARRR